MNLQQHAFKVQIALMVDNTIIYVSKTRSSQQAHVV